MAITSELIGKLGGADVEVFEFDVTASGNMGSELVFHTVTVPEGETWLVAVHGNLISSSVGSYSAQLVIGTTELPARAPNGIIGLAHVGTGTINVKLRRNRSNNSDSFSGHVYTVKM